MKALTFQGKQKVECVEVEKPKIVEDTDVVVKVIYAAICGSDLHPYHEREKGLAHGTVMGHEFTGTIVELGSVVQQFKIGDLVCCPFSVSCGQCFFCKRKLTSRCERAQVFGWVSNNKGLQGAQSEFVRVPLADGSLVKINPQLVTQEEAILLGDVWSTGYHYARSCEVDRIEKEYKQHSNKDEPQSGFYCVVGLGPIGLASIAGLIHYGANPKHIYAIDREESRLLHASRFGAGQLINISKQDAVQIIKKDTNGRGCDAVIEAVGSPAAGRAAYDLIRSGGVISTAGCHCEEHISFSPDEAYDKNITFKVGRCPSRAVMAELLDSLAKGELHYPKDENGKNLMSSLFTHRMHVTKGAEAYRIFDQKLDGCIKVLLTFEEQK